MIKLPRLPAIAALLPLTLLLQNCMTTDTGPEQKNLKPVGSRLMLPKFQGAPKTGYFDGEKVDYLEMDGLAYLADDVIIPLDRITAVPSLAKASGASTNNTGRKWPNNLVYYKAIRARPGW